MLQVFLILLYFSSWDIYKLNNCIVLNGKYTNCASAKAVEAIVVDAARTAKLNMLQVFIIFLYFALSDIYKLNI